MLSPKVTVVTVVRNGAETIANTIESVLRQTYPNLEYLVIDGASSDGTVEIVRTYADRISALVSEPDRGVGDAFNKGAALASGKAILYMNAGDEFLENNSLEKLVSGLPPGANLQQTIVYGDSVIVLPSGATIPAKADHNTLRTSKLWKLCHQSALIGIDLQRRFPYDTRLSANMDYDFWLRCLSNGAHFEHVEAPICNYRAGGISGNPDNSVAHIIESGLVRLMNKRTPKTVSGVAELFKDALIADGKRRLKILAGDRLYFLIKRGVTSLTRGSRSCIYSLQKKVRSSESTT